MTGAWRCLASDDYETWKANNVETEFAELKDTKRLDFEEVKAFSEGLRSLGPVAVATAAEPSAAEVLR